jgi:hypothetical protein
LSDVYLPCQPGTKECIVTGWSDDPPPPVVIKDGENRALRLDDPKVDVDFDCREARLAGPRFLQDTRSHGRPSVGVTHSWYEADDARPEKFLDVVKVGSDFPVLVEIRAGRGQYTVVPPSRVPITKGGSELETLTWFNDTTARRCDFPALRIAVCYCAITALVARHYAPDGVRWQFIEALAGFFLGSLKLTADIARTIIETAADIVGDRDTKPGPSYWINSTEDRLKAGQPCIGAPKVAELIGEHGAAVVAQIRKWLGQTDDLILDPNDPVPSARVFAAREYTIKDTLTLRHQTGVFYEYTRDAGAYLERDEASVRSHLYRFRQVPTEQGKNRKRPRRAQGRVQPADVRCRTLMAESRHDSQSARHACGFEWPVAHPNTDALSAHPSFLHTEQYRLRLRRERTTANAVANVPEVVVAER